jgi:HEPN domain-containing protein
MNIPDQDHIDKVILWISYAEEDLGLAQFALKMPGSRPYRLIAFHAQQCAEKYLKAYMVYHDIDFPFTHEMKKLLNYCGSHRWIEEIKDAEELTPYAVTARYPGVDEVVTENEAVQAVDIAFKVRNTIRKVLTDEGMTLEEDTPQ